MNKFALLFPLALVSLAGCETTTGPVYQPAPVSQAQHAQYGQIIGVRTVEVRSSGDQAAGAIIGGIAGAAIGHQFGQGSGKAAMTGAGAITGAIIGSNIAARPGYRLTQEWTVRLDSGATLTVLQDAGGLRVGRRVMVVTDANGTRLSPY